MSYQEKKDLVLKAHDHMLKSDLSPKVTLQANLVCELTLIRLLFEDMRSYGWGQEQG